MTSRDTYRPSLASRAVACLMRPRAVHRRFLPDTYEGGNHDYARFIVMAHQRSGSTALIGRLRKHSQIHGFGEIFTRGQIGFNVKGYRNDCKLLRKLRDSYPAEFLERVVFAAYNDNIRAVGFKLFADQLKQSRFEAVWSWLDQHRDVKVVLLRRQNLLAAYTSLKVAEQTGVWGISDPSQRPRIQVTLDYQEMIEAFQKRRRLNEETALRLAGHDVHSLSYEEMIRDMDGHLARVQDFLGVRGETLKSKSLLTEVRPLREVTANYDELRQRCAGSEWSEFFEDPFRKTA